MGGTAPRADAGCPWGDGPLIGNAFGSTIYFGLVVSMLEDSLPFVVETARKQGLVAVDPQTERLLT
jgi:hypothetical protein